MKSPPGKRERHFPLMLYASAKNRDWGVGCIESRSYHIISLKLQLSASLFTMGGGGGLDVDRL
jgi:hypothetical protein